MTSFRLFAFLVMIAAAIIDSAATAATIRGTVDGIKDGRINGWALDPASPSTPISIFVYMDGPKGTGKLMNSQPTGAMRPDVNTAQGATGAHGFSWQIPAEEQKQRHLWYIYAGGSADSAEPIHNSPGLYPSVTASATVVNADYLAPTLRHAHTFPL